MAMWGPMPLPPIHLFPQEPWEAQEYAHRDRSRVKFSFCGRPGIETRQKVTQWTSFRSSACTCPWQRAGTHRVAARADGIGTTAAAGEAGPGVRAHQFALYVRASHAACALQNPHVRAHTPKKHASRNRKRGVSRTGMCASEVRTRTDCETRPGRSLVCVSCVASVLFMRRLLWWSSGLVRLVVALWARICSD
jgi:hypothetical protein